MNGKAEIIRRLQKLVRDLIKNNLTRISLNYELTTELFIRTSELTQSNSELLNLWMRDEKESEQQKYSSPTNAEKEISPIP